MNQQSTHRINIAIDGPAGAGKSTVARLVARAMHYVYVDTGAMYRAVTCIALERGIPPDHEAEVTKLANAIDIVLKPGEEGQRVLVDGKDITSQIRTHDVNRNVSRISAISEVRSRMSDLQRCMAQEKGVVMDGRDIGTYVLPDAELKVFLTASPRERALRRYRELGDGAGVTLEQLEREIIERDTMDQEREVAPLLRAPDARLIDSTGLSIECIVDEIVEWGQSASRTISAGEK